MLDASPSNGSQSLPLHNVGDDFTSCIENLLINLAPNPELEHLKLCELEAPAQDGLDLKFSLVILSVGMSFWIKGLFPSTKNKNVTVCVSVTGGDKAMLAMFSKLSQVKTSGGEDCSLQT